MARTITPPPLNEDQIARGQSLGRQRSRLLAQLAATRTETAAWVAEAAAAGAGIRPIARILGVSPQAVAGFLGATDRHTADEAPPAPTSETAAVADPTRLPDTPPSNAQLGLWHIR